VKLHIWLSKRVRRDENTQTARCKFGLKHEGASVITLHF
jgi:hypothetical protein